MTPEGLEFKLGGESCIMNHAPLLLVQGDCGEAPQVVQHVFRVGRQESSLLLQRSIYYNPSIHTGPFPAAPYGSNMCRGD